MILPNGSFRNKLPERLAGGCIIRDNARDERQELRDNPQTFSDKKTPDKQYNLSGVFIF